jgi:hypothetical protein
LNFEAVQFRVMCFHSAALLTAPQPVREYNCRAAERGLDIASLTKRYGRMDRRTPPLAAARERFRWRYLEILVAVLLTAAAAGALIWSILPQAGMTAGLSLIAPIGTRTEE